MPAAKKIKKISDLSYDVTVDKNWKGVDPNDPFLKKKREDAEEFLKKNPIPEWFLNYKGKK
jgi:hypothetical protein